jgi:hypothetical protein
MRRTMLLSLTALLSLATLAGTAAADTLLAGGLLLGYSGGPGIQLNGRVAHFAEALPLGARFGIGYTSVDPGTPLDARRIFINDATNGTPEEKGWFWDFRFDMIYTLSSSFAREITVYGGPRYALFTGNFNFIGGNEDFDITSRQWGFGLGMQGDFAMNSRTDFVISGGFDWFASSKLEGHDTVYAPDGETVNGRNDYTFDDADEAVNQPKIELQLLLGIQRRFGG